MSEKLKYYLALNKIPNLNYIKFKKLLNYFGSVENIWNAKGDDFYNIPDIRKSTIEALLQYKEKIQLDEEYEKVIKSNLSVLTIDDDNYPCDLKNISDPPIVLYIKGRITEDDKNAIAVVGSRRATSYGKETAKKISYDLAKRGITVVSGLARGIDTWAHLGALSAKGRTIAVLGCGINIVYPKENRDLYEKISASGAVISEFPLSTPPYAHNFPRRNRIISGLSKGVVVVEASQKSGALITANFAVEQGKDVFAVPGSITSDVSKGTHRLIKEGAKLTESIQDILEEFGIKDVTEEIIKKREVLPEVEKIVYDTLSCEEKYLDEIIQESGLPASVVSSTLLLLEMKGLAKQHPGKIFVKN